MQSGFSTASANRQPRDEGVQDSQCAYTANEATGLTVMLRRPYWVRTPWAPSFLQLQAQSDLVSINVSISSSAFFFFFFRACPCNSRLPILFSGIVPATVWCCVIDAVSSQVCRISVPSIPWAICLLSPSSSAYLAFLQSCWHVLILSSGHVHSFQHVCCASSSESPSNLKCLPLCEKCRVWQKYHPVFRNGSAGIRRRLC